MGVSTAATFPSYLVRNYECSELFIFRVSPYERIKLVLPLRLCCLLSLRSSPNLSSIQRI